MTLLRIVEPQFRTQWESFTVQDEYLTQFLLPVNVVTLTSKMVGVIFNQKQWSGIRYLNDDGEYEIGYGIGDPDDAQGYTEEESYSEWIGYARNRQKDLRAQLPIVSIPNSMFDALMSYYIDTGTWRTVQADEGTYDLADAVRNGNWLLAADMIARGNVNSKLRKREAAVARLADYSAIQTRQKIRIKGIQRLRTQYIAGLPTDFDVRQAEFVYYRQLGGTFLPGMSDLRKRRIVAQARE